MVDKTSLVKFGCVIYLKPVLSNESQVFLATKLVTMFVITKCPEMLPFQLNPLIDDPSEYDTLTFYLNKLVDSHLNEEFTYRTVPNRT